jgi:hypothetical protein
MELRIDGDLQAVAEFMQRNIPASKLMSVADELPKMGRLLWAHYPQEPSVGLRLSERPLTNGLQQDASVSDPALPCVDGGSVVEEDGHLQRL